MSPFLTPRIPGRIFVVPSAQRSFDNGAARRRRCVPLRRGCREDDADRRPALLPPPEKYAAPLPFWQECQALMKVSTPAFFHGLLAFSLTSIVFLFVGRLGAFQLSIASLALSFFYLTGASIATGLSMGIETIGGQAYGAGNFHLTSLSFLQGLSISLAACVLVSLCWSRAEWIFLIIGQEPVLAQKAAFYLQLLIPYLFTEAIFSCVTKSLASRGIVRPTNIACSCAVVAAPLLSWLLIFKTDLGLYGAPVTLTVVSSLTLILLAVLTQRTQLFERRPPLEWLREGWLSFRTYISVTLPGLATVCSEWWTYEVFTVLAGVLPSAELSLGIMGAANMILNILFCIAMALAAGVLVRVSNALGAGSKRAAVDAAKTALIVTFLVESFSLVAVCVWAWPISRIWFTDAVAGESFVSVLPLVSLSEWGSGMSFVIGGILRACNRAKFEFLANFSCYWVVGIPLGIFLGFGLGMGVKGFWQALVVASHLQLVVLLVVLSRLDVDLEIERAHNLTRS